MIVAIVGIICLAVGYHWGTTDTMREIRRAEIR